jgi:DNA-binding CsgD family transcriptional regulator
MGRRHLARSCDAEAAKSSAIVAQAHTRFPGMSEAIGFVLFTEPIYANESALQILTYPDYAGGSSLARERMASIVGGQAADADLRETTFLSGRRLYCCRCFVLEPRDSRATPIRAMVLERHARHRHRLYEASHRFHLSRREQETVGYLVDGLTTKEVAARMSVSPNTVKQFVRFAMSKMGVSTRAGIVAKALVPVVNNPPDGERHAQGGEARPDHRGRTNKT